MPIRLKMVTVFGDQSCSYTSARTAPDLAVDGDQLGTLEWDSLPRARSYEALVTSQCGAASLSLLCKLRVGQARVVLETFSLFVKVGSHVSFSCRIRDTIKIIFWFWPYARCANKTPPALLTNPSANLFSSWAVKSDPVGLQFSLMLFSSALKVLGKEG